MEKQDKKLDQTNRRLKKTAAEQHLVVSAAGVV